MKTNNLDNIYKEILRIFGNNSCPLFIFNRLLNKLKPETTKSIPLNYFIKEIANTLYTKDDLKNTLDFFSESENIRLFNRVFIIIEDEEEFELSFDEVRNGLEGKEIIHPRDGMPINNFIENLYMYFIGTDLLNHLIREKQGATS